MNNLTVNSILDNKYSEYFGFTPSEVREMAAYYAAGDKYAELCAWYDGYRFGNSDIFNPWSVINYFRNDCQPRPYWQATGSNEIIGEVLSELDDNDDIADRLLKLIQGETVISVIDTGVIYPQVRNYPSSVFSFLLVAGYLKAVKSSVSLSGDFLCEVALPNREISMVYRREILQKVGHMLPQSSVSAVQE